MYVKILYYNEIKKSDDTLLIECEKVSWCHVTIENNEEYGKYIQSYNDSFIVGVKINCRTSVLHLRIDVDKERLEHYFITKGGVYILNNVGKTIDSLKVLVHEKAKA